MKVAVVGATGMVGREMLKQLEERNFPISTLLPIASEKSAGKLINFKNNSIPVIGIENSLDVRADIALFSAGSDISLKWAPKFSNNGTSLDVTTHEGNYNSTVVEKPFYDPKKKIASS